MKRKNIRMKAILTTTILIAMLFSIGNVSAVAPSQSGVVPATDSTNIALTPSLYVVVNDTAAGTLNATWWSNSSGAWVQFASNSTIPSDTNITQVFDNATSYSTAYYWSLNLSNETGGFTNTTYNLTTRTAPYVAPVVEIDLDAVMNMVNLVVQLAIVFLFLGVAFKMLGKIKI